MVYQYTITPAVGFARVRQAILDRAERDPGIVVGQRGAGVDTLVFCIDEAGARLQRGRGQTEVISAAFGALDLVSDAGVINVEQQCSDAALKQLEPLVRWILREFGPCRVYDRLADCDISVQAEDPGFLFA